ncbi:PIN domain-containing protein [Roseateles oligotrophus]|uniref:PIN domain-containing protein n=1 Tax=Roseateles oligotrophus TaxID=1769250 RepID=A0ABT2YDR7_9BURK|nr:PIN domain-containing protein [Roseateles oligotrophus]MCV2368169.1 PIN domain-containing protein [Roseateles oligotrophus]
MPAVVIDTQVIMDWLVFKNKSVMPLIESVQAGALSWIGLTAMKAELLHVLGRGIASSYGPDLALIDEAFARWCRVIDHAPLPAIRLVCRDKDDQMFIDLALSERAQYLISKDRAVLALAKRARRAGLAILTPEAWVKQQASPAPPLPRSE